MYLLPGPRRDVAHELLQARILVLEARLLELEAAARAVFCLPAEGYSFVTLEREVVLQALENTQWYQKQAADLLHMSARVLNSKMKRLKIRPRRGGSGHYLREPLIVTPLAVAVPIAEVEIAAPQNPYWLYDADGALLAVRSPSNDRHHRKRQQEQIVLMLEALQPYPERHRTKELVAHIAERERRLNRRRRAREDQ